MFHLPKPNITGSSIFALDRSKHTENTYTPSGTEPQQVTSILVYLPIAT